MTSKNNKPEKQTEWEPEAAIDLAATLQELIDEPPFKEVSDDAGSATVGTRIPNWLLRRIVRLKELKHSPYDINSDVLRDSIYIGLRVLHLRYGLTPDWEVETKLAATVDAVSATRRLRSQIEELVAGLDEMYRDGDTEKAARNLSDYVMAAVELEAGWHRDKLFKLLAENRVVRDVAKHCGEAVRRVLDKENKK